MTAVLVETPSVTALIVDDHALFAQALASSLQTAPVMSRVLTAGCVGEALGVLRAEHVDVVLLDLRLPDSRGMSGVRAVIEASPWSAVVLVTATEDDETLLDAIDNGCRGFVLKTGGLDDLTGAVHRALSGESQIPTDMVARALARRRMRAPDDARALTPRERDVMDGILAGRTNGEIAAQLFLSVNTVRNHVQSLLSKLGVHSKLEVAALVARHGGTEPTPW